MPLILTSKQRCGLTPHAWAGGEGGIERPIQSADWSIQSPSAAAEIHLSQSVQFAACLRGLTPGVAQVQARVVADGKEFTAVVDVQIVEAK